MMKNNHQQEDRKITIKKGPEQINQPASGPACGYGTTQQSLP